MKVVVTSFGSDGDFNPMLAIAAALVRRGEEVTFVANPFYERRVKSTGARFVGAGEHVDVFAALSTRPDYLRPGAGAVAIWKDLVAPSVRAVYPVVLDTVRAAGATAVVSHLLSLGGIWAATATGARNVVVSTSPSAWLSRHQPTVFANWRAPRPLQGALSVLLRHLGGALLRRAARPLAIELRVPTDRPIVPIADLNLGVWPEWFRPSAPDDPQRGQPCGFVFDTVDAARPLASEVEGFLAAGEEPIVAGFGSAASLHAAERYRAVAEACARLRRRCLLIGASANAVAAGPSVMIVPRAPYARVFPGAAAVIHHGGFGTCGEALRSGRPTLITPIAFDQFDTAARLEDAGLGRWLRTDATDSTALASALEALLQNRSLREASRRAAQRIADEGDGADRAAELIASARHW